ncbi:putative ankyrin repeat protein RF_0381 isoform X2 [Haliotis rubra]|uniref:putative ankyrin repeat protein RF_0381 isoform X2 n=1 Tax=Haliotis rubra TaxID=36100 RepID=UPI001EE537C2|nr:putative ankyrin repeat protein RF_0381 isoform X2 [Haliotis rubra]
MEVCISASLPLTPLDVDIFELKGEKWITEYATDITRKDEIGRSMLHQAAILGNRTVVSLSLKSGCNVDDPDSLGNTALHYAVTSEQNSASVSRLLIEGGTNIEVVNRDGYTPLHRAVAKKNLEIVELFAEKFGMEESNPTSSNPTDISYLTKLMVKHGADVNALNKEKLTPLQVAASWQSFDVVAVLLTEGADANVVDTNGQTPLHHVYGSNQKTGAVTKTYRLKEALGISHVGSQSVVTDEPDNDGASEAPSSKLNIPDSAGNTPLHSALTGNFTQGAITLVKAGASVNTKNNIMDTPLHTLAGNTNTEITKSENNAVIKVIECSRDVDVKDNSGNTPLMLAVEMNKDISPLLKAGAEVNAKNKHGGASLIIAVQRDHVKMVETLIKAGSDVNTSSAHGDTALMIAVERGCEENVSAILQCGADVNASNTCGETALHKVVKHAISKQCMYVHARRNVEEKGKRPSSPFNLSHDIADIVETLLKGEADINAKDHKGQTPLMTAIEGISKEREGEINLIPQLIAGGANVNAQDSVGQTPLMMAVKAGYDISPLLKAGADVISKNKSGKTALHLVYEYYYFPPIKRTSMCFDHDKERKNNNASQLIAAGADVSAQDDNGNTPLMMAVAAGHDISLLLTTGADVNSKNKSGKTALHFVSENGCGFDTIIIQKLIAAGADVNAQDDNGNSPLMMAVKEGRDISRLLTAGADVNSKNTSGKTALHFVSEGNRSFRSQKPISVHHLIAAGADVNAQDNVGNTSLHMCIMYKDYQNAMVLLNNPGTDVSITNRSGQSVLHLADADEGFPGIGELPQTYHFIRQYSQYHLEYTKTELVRAILSKNPDLHAQDKQGRNPLDIAKTSSDKLHEKFRMSKAKRLSTKTIETFKPRDSTISLPKKLKQ